MSTHLNTTLPYQRTPVPDRFSRSDWFRRARLGMFIHWGVYSAIGRGEWVRSHEEMSSEDYAPWAQAFNPQSVDFDAWAALAQEAGMEYAVLTAKHHDGYCLFDSQYSTFSSAAMAPKRDFVAEFLEAFRKRGIRVGLYFTLIDWSHPDYPHYGDSFHPERNNPAFTNEDRDFNRYLDFMHAQVEELCTRYGTLDILWFDFSYGELTGEAWRATELMAMVRRHQPDAVVDNRLEVSASGFGSIVTDSPSSYCGDFVSPEQIVPPEGILGHDRAPVPWESCVTLNNHWAWHHSDRDYKSGQTLIRKLVEVVSKGGNLLLNVGPDAQGRIPDESARVLRYLGQWVHTNSASIKGAEGSALAKPEWGRWTQRGRYLYAHVLEQPIGPLPLPGVDGSTIESVKLLATGEELHLASSWVIEAYPDLTFVAFGPEGGDDSFTHMLPDTDDTVVEITLREPGTPA